MASIISTNDILMKKMETAGIDKLVSIYGEQFNRRLTNMKSSSIPLENRRNLIISKIMRAIAISDDKAHDKKIMDIYFPEKPKEEKPIVDWMSNFTIGEEVLICGKYMHNANIKGKIAKINKKSVTVKLFAYTEISDKNAYENQTYGNNRLIWETFTNDSKVVFDKKSIIKKGEISCIDAEFIEGKRPVDYGN
jgi:hypothetical protein